MENQMSIEEHSFFNRIERIKKGFEVAKQYCELENTTIYIILNRHTGDAARVLEILDSVKSYYGNNSDRFHFLDGQSQMNPMKKTKLIEKLVVVTTRSISGVAKLYSYAFDELIVLPKDQLDYLEMYSCSPCAVHQNIVCDEDAYRIVYGRWRTDEGSWARSALVGCHDFRWYLSLPKSAIKKTDMAIDDKTISSMQEVIKGHSIDLDKTVIICPHAKNSSMLPEQCWVLFSEELKKNGYRVFTNAIGDEPTVEGTERLSVDMDIMVCLANRGCKIIGVQSGLMDILIRVKTQFVTIISVIKRDSDIRFAKSRGVLNEVNNINGVIYLRIEHFEEEYVLKLLMDNFI